MQTILVSSDNFNKGGKLSLEYTCDGENISPEIHWNGIPDNTQSIALVMDDPDAPGRTFVHWVVYNIPADNHGLPAGMPKDMIQSDGTLQGMNDFSCIGYSGPCPPHGKPHRYFFKVYALDTTMDRSGGITKSQLEKAMSGHILAEGEIIVKYGR